MRNEKDWRPTKFVLSNGKLFATSDRKYFGIGDRFFVQMIASAYEKHIPVYCRGDLADIGCGFVPLYDFYKQYVDSVTTVDWAESFHANGHLDIVADLNKAPIPGLECDSFDCAICSDVLEHIYEPKTLLREINRILKPHGTLLLNVPFYFYIHESPHDYHRYTEWSLKRYLEDTGFEIMVFEPLGGIVTSWITLTSLCMCGFGPPGRLTAAMLQAFCGLMRRSRYLNRLFMFKSDMVPTGYFVAAQKKEASNFARQ